MVGGKKKPGKEKKVSSRIRALCSCSASSPLLGLTNNMISHFLMSFFISGLLALFTC
jgi:hypothetical protein